MSPFRLTSVSNPQSSNRSYSSAPPDGLIATENGNSVTNHGYDTMGRLTTVTYPDSSTTAYAYDANGNRTSLTDSTGTTTWVYDSVNRMTSESKAANTITNAYDANSNLISQTNPNGTTVTEGYNSADWLTSVINKNSSATVLSSFTYGYNTDGLRSSVTEADGSQVSYGYDSLHRLTSEVRTGTNPYNLSYGYDPAGNRLNQVRDGVGTSYTYDDANRLLTAGSTTNTWDANGNLLSKTTGGVTTNFAYNFDDQLTSITGPTNVSFAYDGLTRRVSRTTGGVTTSFFHDVVRITTEKQGATLTAHYTYGRDLLSRDDGTNYAYYLVDGLGSARQLTDASQAVVSAYVSEGFGSIVAQTGAAPNSYKFAATSAYRDDGDAGLLHVGLRYYDPSVGRFTTADPLLGDGINPQSLNRYLYVTNNPVNLVDPTGTQGTALRVIGVVLIALGDVAIVFSIITVNPLAAVIGVGLIVVGVILYSLGNNFPNL